MPTPVNILPSKVPKPSPEIVESFQTETPLSNVVISEVVKILQTESPTFGVVKSFQTETPPSGVVELSREAASDDSKSISSESSMRDLVISSVTPNSSPEPVKSSETPNSSSEPVQSSQSVTLFPGFPVQTVAATKYPAFLDKYNKLFPSSDAEISETFKKNPQSSSMMKRGIVSYRSLGRSHSTSSLHRLPPPHPVFKDITNVSTPERDYPLPLPNNVPAFDINPTLIEKMSEEHKRELSKSGHDVRKKRVESVERINKVIADSPFRDYNSKFGKCDITLTVAARDGIRITVGVHREILSSRSIFFSERFKKNGSTLTVEILESNVETYLEALGLMYSDDVSKKLLGMEASKVLGLLKVCASIKFKDGLEACSNYLALIPWAENEERDVVSYLNNKHAVPKRISTVLLQRRVGEPATSSRIDDLFIKLLGGVLLARDDKARKEVKTSILCLIKENGFADRKRADISTEMLYNLCHKCLGSLLCSLTEGAKHLGNPRMDNGLIMKEVSRETDNLEWIAEILIERRACVEFVKIWASRKDLALLHSKFPTMFTYEFSRITALICIAIGRRHIAVPHDTLYLLLETWLEPLYDDFKWIKRGSKSLDKKLLEEGLCHTILTLPMIQQQQFIIRWYFRFLERGEDCPNIMKAFVVWWRRVFQKTLSF